MMRPFRALLLIVLLAGCGSGDSSAKHDDSRGPLAAEDLHGVWRIVGHRIPGASAMDRKTAETWNGRTVFLASDLFVADHVVCAEPWASLSTIATEELLRLEFHLDPGSLPALKGREHTTLMEIGCGDGHWDRFGGRWLIVDRDRALVPWDGVFFAVERVDPATAAPPFVDRVWEVTESAQVAVRSRRVFLSDGTLVMTSPGSTPALGTWQSTDDGMLITEEGISYPTEILESGGDRFRIRIHGPGDPADITFGPAS